MNFFYLFGTHHFGWSTGVTTHYIFDQSQPRLIKSYRLPCDWLILSLVLSHMADVSADTLFFGTKCVLEHFHVDKFRETEQDATLKGLRIFVIFQSFPINVMIFRFSYCA